MSRPRQIAPPRAAADRRRMRTNHPESAMAEGLLVEYHDACTALDRATSGTPEADRARRQVDTAAAALILRLRAEAIDERHRRRAAEDDLDAIEQLLQRRRAR